MKLPICHVKISMWDEDPYEFLLSINKHDDDQDILESVFALTNWGSGANIHALEGHRSTSVGDVVILTKQHTSTAWRCQPSGWALISYHSTLPAGGGGSGNAR